MKRYLFVITSILFLAAELAFGQSVSVKSISDEDSQILVRNGWELVYTTNQFRIRDFALDTNGIIISARIDDRYHLILLNNEHIQEKDKSVVKASKLRMNYPNFFNSGDKQVFGPCGNFYFETDWNKFKIRRNRYPFKRIKGKGDVYYRQDIYYEAQSGKMDLGSVISFNRNEKLQTQYLLDYSLRELDTLYKVSHHKDVLNYNAISPFLQFEVSNDERFIYVLDNINGLLIVLDEDKGVTKIELKDLDIAKSAFLKDFPINLRKDLATGRIYLIYSPPMKEKSGGVFKVGANGEITTLKSKQLQSASLGSKIYNGKLYTRFKIEELKTSAIYAVDLEQE